MGFVIAILLCLGDNCDLVRPEPEVTYPTYEQCSEATAKKAEEFGKVAEAHREQGRESEIICLHPLLTVVELDEEHVAMVPTEVRSEPSGTARAIGSVARGNKVHVTGAIAGTKWLRIALPNGGSGYVFGERFRQLSFDEINAAATKVAAAAPQTPAPAPEPRTPGQNQTVAAIAPAAPVSIPPARAPPARTGTSEPQQQAMLAVPKPPPKAHEEFRDCPNCPVMIALPGGSFEMGSGNDPSERPVHRVVVAPFAIGRFAVTQGEWAACVAGGGCTYKSEIVNERLPAMNLSFADAQQYAQWLRRITGRPYRLPSEAEWEYAARAGGTTPYAWGAQVGVAKANCSGCGGSYDPQLPAVVGSFPPNAWGLYDMEGGVAQWVEDCWHRSYEGAPANGAAWMGPRCAEHVLRGGSWKNPPKDIMVSTRNYYDTSVRYVANGMRVAMGPAAAAERQETPVRARPRYPARRAPRSP